MFSLGDIGSGLDGLCGVAGYAKIAKLEVRMFRLVAVAVMLCGCQAPKGDPSTIDLAFAPGTDLAGFVQPRAITCLPGKAFCATASQVATCTLSGGDAVLGADCTAVGSATNPGSCVATGCPVGQAACCRRQKPLWKWTFTQPAIVGESYVGFETGKPYLSPGKSCTGSALAITSAAFYHPQTTCPTDYVYVSTNFNRTTTNIGVTVDLAAPGVGNSFNFNNGTANTCTAWTGTMKIDADLPDWSVTVNAVCSTGTLAGTQIAGTMSGSE
jgi:hypothetical protein